MKKVTLTLVLVIAGILSAFAQTPQAFKYQAMVRDGAGIVLANQPVSFQMSIHDGSAGGTVVYRETHSTTTNQTGLANLEVGSGTPVSGIFADIDWGGGSKFLEVELDPAGGTSYVSMGTAQLMSVPYSLFSENTANTDDADADPTNELNTSVALNGTDLEVTDAGGTITTDLSGLVDDADADPTNELQTLSVNGEQLTISNGNTVNLPQEMPAGVAGQTLRNDGTAWVTDDNLTNDGSKIGIGTTAPDMKLTIDNDGGILAKGEYNNGELLTETGAGTKLIWYPRKAAFRAGRVSDSEWNEAELGPNSVAFGYNSKAIGDGSFSMGLNSYTAGLNSVAMGANVISMGDYSLAMGLHAQSSNDNSVAIGQNVWSIGDNSIVLGKGVGPNSRLINNIDNSLMVGFDTEDPTLFVGGPDKRVGILTENPSTEFEVNGTVTATAFVGDGSGLTGISGDNLGDHTATQNLDTDGNWISGDGNNKGIMIDADGKVGVGRANPAADLHIFSSGSWGKPHFAIHDADNDITYFLQDENGLLIRNAGAKGSNNAFSFRDYNDVQLLNIHSNGNIGIGTDNPEAPLQITNGSDASLAGGGYIISGDVASRNIVIDDNEIMARNNGAIENLHLNRDGGDVIINESAGNVGIRTGSPTSELDVNGTVTATAFVGDGSGLTGISASNGWKIAGDDIYNNNPGNVGIGTSNPLEQLHVGGSVMVEDNQPGIWFKDVDGAGTKPRITFENSDRLVIQGQDDEEETLGVYAKFDKDRVNDANLKVYGKSTDTWGNYIEVSHDGEDGEISTDTGNIILNPNGSVTIGTIYSLGNRFNVSRDEDDAGAGKSAINAFRYGVNGVPLAGGTSWAASGVDVAAKGRVNWANSFTAGVAGYSYLDYANSAAVVGADNSGTIKGFLGYKDENSNTWAGYFTGDVKLEGATSELIVDGNITATAFAGDGSGLTGISGDNLGDHTATQNIDLNGNLLTGNGGIDIGDATGDGIKIFRAGNPSSQQSSSHTNGFEVAGAQGYGLFVGRSDNDGVHIYDAGDDGVIVETANDNLFQGGNNGSEVFTVSNTGDVTATSFTGDGSGLTNLAPDNDWGFFGDDMYNKNSGDIGIGVFNPTSKLDVNGTVTATAFVGDGSGLTGISGDNLGNHTATQNLKTNGNWLSGDGGNEGLFVKSDGKVGIGTTSPTGLLTLSSFNENSLYFEYGGDYDAHMGLEGYDLAIYSADDMFLKINEQNSDGTFAIIDEFNSNTLLHIGNNGNVGIGTSNPVEKLHVEGNFYLQDEHPKIILRDNDAGGTKPTIQFENSDRLAIYGEDDSDKSLTIYSKFQKDRTYDASLKIYGKSVNSWGNYIEISHDGDDGIITTDVGHLLLNPASNIGIGTSSPGAYKLYCNGSAAKPGGGAWSVPSDKNLKNLNGNYTRGLNEILQLSPVAYNYKANNAMDLPSDKEYIGLIAQEVEKVIPEAVEEMESGYLSVNNDPVIWTMLNAIKELKQLNDELKAENQEIKARLMALESK